MFKIGTEILVTASSCRNKSGPKIGSKGFIVSIDRHIIDNIDRNTKLLRIYATVLFYKYGNQKKHRLEQKRVYLLVPIPRNTKDVRPVVTRFKNLINNNIGQKPKYVQPIKTGGKTIITLPKSIRSRYKPTSIMAIDIANKLDIDEDLRLSAYIMSYIKSKNSQIRSTLLGASDVIPSDTYKHIQGLLSGVLKVFIKQLCAARSQQEFIDIVVTAKKRDPSTIIDLIRLINLIQSMETKLKINKFEGICITNILIKEQLVIDLYLSMFDHDIFSTVSCKLYKSGKFALKKVEITKKVLNTLSSNVNT